MYEPCNGYRSYWGNKLNDTYSIAEYCFKLQENIITWHNKRQNTIVLSSKEVQFIALSFTIEEAI